MQEKLFKPSSTMTFATAQADYERLHKYCQEAVVGLLKIDLSEVTYCDSAGLALLIEAKRLAKAEKKTCSIEAMPPMVQALAEFCGVKQLLSSD